ncbi:hypothetical protein ACH5RR_030416 [Cinchona calisaya]|uniref:Cytochrome P450 n=1 Tax=Cinchona calisaya TaxID=153742 RepID=A0ABD2YY74_9GENT
METPKRFSNMREHSSGRTLDISHYIFPGIQPHIYSWTRIYGKNFVYWHGPKAKLVVSEPELIRELMNHRDISNSRGEVEEFMKRILGDGILTSEGAKWLKLRKLSNHAFHAESLRNMIPAMVESVENMLKGWRHYDGKEIEVTEELRNLASEVISKTAFGSSYLEGKQIFETFQKFMIIVGRNAYKIRLPVISHIFKSNDDRESERLEKGVRDSIIKISNKREKLQITGGEPESSGDFLGLLLKAYHDPNLKNKISIEEIIDECKAFYIAGHSPISDFLSWTVLFLSIHTDWQDKARKEVLEIFGDNIPNAEGISRLKTMSMIINESLRLYPPVIFTERKAEKETRIRKLILPANTDIQIPILAIHHDPKIWGENAHLFKPERFQEGIAGATNSNSAAVLPFGRGARACVGLNFTYIEAKITLSIILQHYAFTLSPTYMHSPVHIMSLTPQTGIQLCKKAIRRWACGNRRGEMVEATEAGYPGIPCRELKGNGSSNYRKRGK